MINKVLAIIVYISDLFDSKSIVKEVVWRKTTIRGGAFINPRWRLYIYIYIYIYIYNYVCIRMVVVSVVVVAMRWLQAAGCGPRVWRRGCDAREPHSHSRTRVWHHV